MSDIPSPGDPSTNDRIEAERKRIGHELHDGVGQYITGIRMLSEHLEAVLPDGDSDQTRCLVNQIAEFARAATMQLKYIQHNLAPPELDDTPIEEGLHDLCELVGGIPDMECGFEIAGDVPTISEDRRHHLYRIAQEAVHNAMRHGDATTITLRLCGDSEEQVVLTIGDDGRGFEREQIEERGLRQMHRRAEAIDAHLEIQSAPGRGTTVCCRISEPDSSPVPR